uniref:Uncharacterized protein n=1 Tax=Ditylenchus dipsaci TaxID=166011 RepID=A0A915E7Y4_9BILA
MQIPGIQTTNAANGKRAIGKSNKYQLPGKMHWKSLWAFVIMDSQHFLFSTHPLTNTSDLRTSQSTWAVLNTRRCLQRINKLDVRYQSMLHQLHNIILHPMS